MQIAVLTFDGFNELDSFIAAGILNRVKGRDWATYITVTIATLCGDWSVRFRRRGR